MNSAHRSPTPATPSEAPLHRSVSLKARYYQSAESGSAPALLELEKEGQDLASQSSTAAFGPESVWRGQIQPISGSSAVLPEIRESPAWNASADPGASPKQLGTFWQQQMQRDPDRTKVLPSLQEATVQRHGHHAEPAAGKSITGRTLPEAATALLNDQTSVGLLLYAISTIFAAGMNTCAKLLSKGGLPVFEILLVRSFLMTAAAGGAIINTKISPWGTRRKLLVVRGLLGFLSISGVYWSLKLLPLSDATVLQFIAPLFVTVLAPLILHESPSRMDVAAIPICMAGVLLIAKPSFLFGQHTDRHISYVGIIIGVAQL
ncbi:hypothetical protein WJX74_009986 [Apatococcus lobatus]|uniref:EamA domain-containing protein n=2 Tax=Apatococcus TaxID=904362 RepID=A0AAW1S4U2_9CHLO